MRRGEGQRVAAAAAARTHRHLGGGDDGSAPTPTPTPMPETTLPHPPPPPSQPPPGRRRKGAPLLLLFLLMMTAAVLGLLLLLLHSVKATVGVGVGFLVPRLRHDKEVDSPSTATAKTGTKTKGTRPLGERQQRLKSRGAQGGGGGGGTSSRMEEEETGSPHKGRQPPERGRRPLPQARPFKGWDDKTTTNLTVPPPSIPLRGLDEDRHTNNNNSNNGMVGRAVASRHTCLAAIRERQRRLLGTYLAGNNNKASAAASIPTEVLIVDPAYHKNVGDHMITLGEYEFVKRMQSEWKGEEPRRGRPVPTQERAKRIDGEDVLAGAVRQCGYVQAGMYAEPCDAYLNRTHQEPSSSTSKTMRLRSPSRRVALWHGGGNWGDLWRTLQPTRISSFEALLQHQYTVVGMPQSLYYQDDALARDDARLLKQRVERGLLLSKSHAVAEPTRDSHFVPDAKTHVILCWREAESLRQAELLYPFVTNVIVPDIAFQLGPYGRPDLEAPTLDVLLLLRDDHESTQREYRSKAAVRSLLSNIPGAQRLSFRIVDWDDRLELFDSNDIFFSETSIRLLAMGRVVVCDRLHAAILCYLSGIPFVYLDQISGKISKSLEVAFDSAPVCRDSDFGMWARADNVTHALQATVEFLSKYRLR